MNTQMDKCTDTGFFSTSWPYVDLIILLDNYGVLEVDRSEIMNGIYLTIYNAHRNLIFIPRDIMDFI